MQLAQEEGSGVRSVVSSAVSSAISLVTYRVLFVSGSVDSSSFLI